MCVIIYYVYTSCTIRNCHMSLSQDPRAQLRKLLELEQQLKNLHMLETLAASLTKPKSDVPDGT